MKIITRADIITKQVLNETTGELELIDFREEKQYKRIKGGCTLVYYNAWDSLMEEIITSNTDIVMLNKIKNKFTYARIEVVLSSTDIAKELNVSKPKVTRFIKLLVEKQFLKRVDRGTYRLNPYIFLPIKSNAEQLQQEWNEIKNVL